MTGVQTCALPICFPVTIGLCEEFVFSVNPSSDGGSFGVVRPVAYKSVCASYRAAMGGGIGYQDNRTQDIVVYVSNGMGAEEVVGVFAKPDEQERFSFNGSVIFEGQWDDMLVWFSKGYQDNRTQDIVVYVSNGMGAEEVVGVLQDALDGSRSGSGPRRSWRGSWATWPGWRLPRGTWPAARRGRDCWRSAG